MSKDFKHKSLYSEIGNDAIKWGRLYDIVTPQKGHGIPVGMRKIGVLSNQHTAQAYIDKTGKKDWRVLYEDVNKDGITDVIVYDKDKGKANPIAVNGWTFERDDFPYREAYYQNNRTLEERKQNPFGKWIKTNYFNVSDNAEKPWLNVIEPTQKEFMKLYHSKGYKIPTMPSVKKSPFEIFKEAF